MKVFEFDTVESTQDIALQKNFECVIVAKNQTKGRGRLDRTWQSLEGNLMASVVIKANIEDIFKIVMSISVTIVEAINAGQIKWPNDILINNKKVCGVLIEKGQEGFYVIGFGLNIEHSPNIPNLIYPATCLKEEGIFVEKKETLNKIIKNLKNNMQSIDLYKKYKSKLYGIGSLCKINNIEGIFKDVDKSGFINIETKDETKKIFAGDLIFK